MTVEELKKEAAKLGYNLIKKPPREHYLPCICGCRQREHWIDLTNTEVLKCKRCGLAVIGKQCRGTGNRNL